MKFNTYQAGAKETAIYPGNGEVLGLTYAALGLAGEAGEVAGKVKKILRDDNGTLTPEKRAAIADEVADVLWYIAALADELGVSMEEMAIMNLAKLNSRKERGVLGGSGDTR